jgi:hypothetical protein
MDEAVERENERRARRIRLVVRLVFYPMALGLIVLAWQQYHGDVSRGHVFRMGHWSGVTSQGQEIRARTADEFVAFLSTQVLEPCSNGAVFTVRWRAGQHRFVQHGDDLRGRATGPGRDDSGRLGEYDTQLWGHMGAHPRGTIRGRVTWRATDGLVSCDSGPVTYELHRSP